MYKADGEQEDAGDFHSEDRSPLEILLDPHNPRLEPGDRDRPQAQILLALIRQFKVDELGQSIAVSGYQDFDPLVGYTDDGQVVVREGNRRVAALKLLLNPELAPDNRRAYWQSLRDGMSDEALRSCEMVSIRVYPHPDAIDLEAYIGFRHVNGVLPWPAHEKARFVVDLVERHGWGYQEIAHRIGSYPRHVERHYISAKLVQQARDAGIENAEEIRIGVLLRALQTAGVSEFLGIQYPGVPDESARPVPEDHLENLWLFVRIVVGTGEHERLLTDSRDLTKLGKVLQSEDSLRYVKSARHPSFERAWIKAGGESQSLLETLEAAADNLEDAIPTITDYRDHRDIREAVERCARRMKQLLRDFPGIARALCEPDSRDTQDD